MISTWRVILGRFGINALIMFLLLGLTACSRFSKNRIERRDPDLDRIAPRGARIETLARGFAYTEGPVWMRDGYLLFGDLPTNVIRKWTSGSGVTVVRTRSGYADADQPPGPAMGSNGMTFDAEGRLTICEPGNRRVTRLEADGRLTILADRYEGRRLNSPNDLVYKSDGALYFTDPPTGLIGEDKSSQKELDFNGVFRLAGGELRLLKKELTRPNGIAFSADEKFLYVSNADWQHKIWMRYEVGPDGALSNGTVFLDLTSERGQEPDGMKVDREGNLYCTGPHGIWIVDLNGKILGIIHTRYEPSNCAWGDADRRTLYITGQSEIYRIRLAIPGAGAFTSPKS